MGHTAEMATAPRAYGLRVVIFTNDHRPAHVHVFGNGTAKINLAGPGGTPELIWADNMRAGDVRLVTEHQVSLLARSRERHERTD